MGLKRSVLLGFVLLFLQDSAHAAYSVRQSVKQYVAEVSDAHGFDEKELLALFADAKKKQTILDAIARPAEKTWAWHEYRELFIQPKRIDQGVAFWRANEAALARAEKTYGVSAEVIVAIIGVETFYGRIMGSHRVVDALTTLTFDYPPRAKFFRGELTQFLLLAREERKDPKSL